MAVTERFATRQTLVGVHVLDDELRVVRTTASAHVPHGGALLVPVLGARFTEFYELEDPDEEAAVARRALLSGEPVVGRLVRGGNARGEAARRNYSVSYLRLEDSSGEATRLVASVVDVTAQEHAQHRMAVLDTVRTRVGSGHLNMGAVSRELVEAVVPAFASMAVVDLVEDAVNGQEPPLIPVYPGVVLRRAAIEGPTSEHALGEVFSLPDSTPFSRVLADLEPRLVSFDEHSSWLAADPGRAETVKRSGAGSVIAAPLTFRGYALGMVSFYRDEQEDAFDEDDVVMASAMCAHVALCLDDSRRYMLEWITTAAIQRRLLAPHPAAQTAVKASSLHIPDPAGGSAWFDAIALPGARTALIVGEVPGQGIVSALSMGLLRTATRTLAALDLQPDEILARLSETARSLAATWAAQPPVDPLHSEPLTSSCTIAIYDSVQLTCTIARAGHPEPVAVLPDGASRSLPAPEGPPLAATSEAPFPAETFSLPEGAVLVMGTTAVADEVLAPSGPLRQLLDQISTKNLPDASSTIARALASSNRRGEAIMLFARTKAVPRDRVLICPLPADPEAAPIARAAARRQLGAWGVDEETAYTTELVVSELVGNAVRYGEPPLSLRLILEQVLTCEVRDTSLSTPYVQHARTLDESGRGLFIIRNLTEQWGTRHQAQEKIVWAQIPIRE